MWQLQLSKLQGEYTDYQRIHVVDEPNSVPYLPEYHVLITYCYVYLLLFTSEFHRFHAGLMAPFVMVLYWDHTPTLQDLHNGPIPNQFVSCIEFSPIQV